MFIKTLNNPTPTKMQSCRDYIHALQEERRKIEVFQRELPLCLDLVTQAIETCKQHFSDSTDFQTNTNAQSESSNQTSSGVPVFEEFIPMKRPSSSSSHSDGGEEKQSSKRPRNDDKNLKKSDWLRSVQLWNQAPPAADLSSNSKDNLEMKSDAGAGAFQPFKKDNSAVPVEAPPPTAEAEEGNRKEEKEGHSQRKTRRCWSPELHRRFLQALQQLGGSQVATPKQIRELMKVDGLTNDEVKSHLQKYRLHTKRPTPSSIQMNNGTTQTPQFVVVGGIWVSPPDYASMPQIVVSGEVSDVGTSNEIYAPVAMLPPSFREASTSPKKMAQHKSDDTRNHSEYKCGVQTHSPSTSSCPSS